MANLEKNYSTVAENYDKMIKWEKRLAREIPFFTSILSEVKGNKVLDCACATGQHAVKLAKLGYQVTGSDINPEMIKQAKELIKHEGVNVNFLPSNFLNLKNDINNKFDLIMCIGNSLPHIKDEEELRLCLRNMFDLMLPQGNLVLQNRNYDKFMKEKEKYQLMPLTNWTENNESKLFIRINELNSNQKISFTILTLSEENNNWRMEAERTELYPIQQDEIEKILLEIGFTNVKFYGDYEKKPYDPNTSGDLIIVATK